MNKNISSGNKNIDWNISIVISDLNGYPDIRVPEL